MTELATVVTGWKDMVENNPSELRTKKQNNSLHKGLRNLADKLNDAGLDMQKVFAVKRVSIPWTEDSAREYLFNQISMAMYDGRTSSQLDTKEIQEVWKVLNRHMGENFGITVDWPDRWNQGREE